MKRKTSLLLALLPALAVAWPAAVQAKPNPWAFDFDPNIADDPPYVNKHLQELKAGLPGLPTNAGIVETKTGKVQLYFFKDVIDMMVRARDSGPATLPPLVRQPKICVEHGSFAKPDLLKSDSWLCETSAQGVMAAFEPKKVNTCYHGEFPESYVYDHSPIGFVDVPMVSNWNTLISLIGEALTYVDYPEGLLPGDFYQATRRILARLRYGPLKSQIAGQIKAYQDAIAKAQTDALCFDQAKVPAFVSKVTSMIAELKAVGQHLDGIYQAGLAQAAADRKAVENQGRIRANLPFPALTDRDRELLAIYVAGICWRIRGSGLVNVPDDKTGSGLVRRMLYVQHPYQLIAELAGGTAAAKDVGFQVFFDETWGYAKWYDMGTDPAGNDKYADLVEMTKRGKRATTLVAPTLAGRGFDVRSLVAGGLQMGPCYYFIWEELNTWTGKELLGFVLGEDLDNKDLYPSHVMRFLEWPTATGEVCTGAALALGLVRTLLWGKSGGTVCNPDCTGKPCNADDGCGTPCTAACTGGDAGGDGSPGPDAGVPINDAGVPQQTDSSGGGFTEAGVPKEAGPSSGGDTHDGGGGGCSCRASDGGETPIPAACVLLALALLGQRRRRR